MSPLQIKRRQEPLFLSWPDYGFCENPFPTSGVETGVYYSNYLEGQLNRIVAWIEQSIDDSSRQWSPLVIKGSIGVGKTHVLHLVERSILDLQDPAVEVTRHILTGAGSRSLALSEILVEGFNSVNARFEERTGSSLVDALLRKIDVESLSINLPSSSPIIVPLRTMLKARREDRKYAVRIFGHWLTKVPISRSDYSLLGVSGKIDGEGQSIRALAHLFRLLRQAELISAWIVMIDQIEDLFRKEATTPMKRARFLTDLRTLIDEGFEGTPIPLLLAWNTAIGDLNVSDQLEQQYVALWSRLTEVVDLPALPRESVYPFANEYLDAAHIEFGIKNPRAPKESPKYQQFRIALERALPDLARGIAEKTGDVMPRKLLAELRRWSEGQLIAGK